MGRVGVGGGRSWYLANQSPSLVVGWVVTMMGRPLPTPVLLAMTLTPARTLELTTTATIICTQRAHLAATERLGCRSKRHLRPVHTHPLH